MDIFSKKLEIVEKQYPEWVILRDKIISLLDSSESEDINLLNHATIQIQEAIKIFKDGVANPTLTLATTGTTSSGKSSLVNLLCGAEITPVGVQEMSAGTVFIVHHPTNRSLKIEKVPGLSNEHFGEWSDLPDDEIRLRLQRLMDEYRRLRENNQEPSAPCINIEYPTRLGNSDVLRELPEKLHLRIIDLPGLKHIADQTNRNLIRNSVRPALCLVTYNSEETNSENQKALLEEVVDQVKELGGSPARMLFIFNRIDAFWRDKEPEERSLEFITTTMKKIKVLVGEALKEYKTQAESLQAQPLSTCPALCAYQVIINSGSGQKCIGAFRIIDEQYKMLFPKNIRESFGDLPQDVARWKDVDRLKAAEVMWDRSFGQSFDEALRNHIYHNLPQLLVPHLIATVSDAANAALTNVHQIVNAHVNATQELYHEECNRLNGIQQRLQTLRKDSQKKFMNFVNLPSYDNVKRLLEILTENARKLEKAYSLSTNSLVPLHDWHVQMGSAIVTFLQSVLNSINCGNNMLKGSLIESLPSQYRQAIVNVISNLKNSGYTRYAEVGGYLHAEDESSKAQLRKINQSLNELSKVLAQSLKWLLDRTAERESDRIQNALQVLIDGYSKTLSHEAQKEAPDIVGLSVTPSRITRLRQNLIFSFEFSSGFRVEQGQRTVQTGVERVAVGEKRIWWTLWLAKRTIYEYFPVYEDRSYEKADIPNIDSIFDNFLEQAAASRQEVEFLRWLEKQLKDLLADVGQYQDNLLSEYRHHLDKAAKHAEKQKEENIVKWQGATGLIDNFKNNLNNLQERLWHE